MCSYLSGDRWLNGPRLCQWLEGQVGENFTWPPSLRRRMLVWMRGGRVDLYALDKYLPALNLHPSQIPEECWTVGGPDRGRWARERASA